VNNHLSKLQQFAKIECRFWYVDLMVKIAFWLRIFILARK